MVDNASHFWAWTFWVCQTAQYYRPLRHGILSLWFQSFVSFTFVWNWCPLDTQYPKQCAEYHTFCINCFFWPPMNYLSNKWYLRSVFRLILQYVLGSLSGVFAVWGIAPVQWQLKRAWCLWTQSNSSVGPAWDFCGRLCLFTIIYWPQALDKLVRRDHSYRSLRLAGFLLCTALHCTVCTIQIVTNTVISLCETGGMNSVTPLTFYALLYLIHVQLSWLCMT